MKKVDAGYRLDEEIKCSLLSEAALLLDQNKQVALRHVLHDEVDVLVILEVCIHANNIHMLQLLVDLNLAPQCLFHLRCLNHSLVQFFNGNFYSARLMQSQLHLPV